MGVNGVGAGRGPSWWVEQKKWRECGWQTLWCVYLVVWYSWFIRLALELTESEVNRPKWVRSWKIFLVPLCFITWINQSPSPLRSQQSRCLQCLLWVSSHPPPRQKFKEEGSELDECVSPWKSSHIVQLRDQRRISEHFRHSTALSFHKA